MPEALATPFPQEGGEESGALNRNQLRLSNNESRDPIFRVGQHSWTCLGSTRRQRSPAFAALRRLDARKAATLMQQAQFGRKMLWSTAAIVSLQRGAWRPAGYAPNCSRRASISSSVREGFSNLICVASFFRRST